MRLGAIALVALFLTTGLTGCIGDGDEEAEPNTVIDEPGPEEAANQTRPAVWAVATHEGTITGASAVVVGTNAPESDTIVEFQVGEGTQELGLLASAEGGPLDMLIAAPGCQVNSGCEESVTVDPEAGQWTLRFFYSGPGAGQVSYTVDVGHLIPPANGNATAP